MDNNLVLEQHDESAGLEDWEVCTPRFSHSQIRENILQFEDPDITDDDDYEERDFILNLPSPLGKDEVQRRLLLRPWLMPMLDKTWHGRSVSPYIRAWGCAVRVVITTAVLRTRSPDDIATALNLPKLFILMVLLMIWSASGEQDILIELNEAVEEGKSPAYISDHATEFVTNHFPNELGGLNVLRVLGLGLS